jgi:hypothetical protein
LVETTSRGAVLGSLASLEAAAAQALLVTAKL